MKIDLDVKELKELIKTLTPQVTLIENGQIQPTSMTPLPTISEMQTSEKDYLAAVAYYSTPPMDIQMPAKPNGQSRAAVQIED